MARSTGIGPFWLAGLSIRSGDGTTQGREENVGAWRGAGIAVGVSVHGLHGQQLPLAIYALEVMDPAVLKGKL